MTTPLSEETRRELLKLPAVEKISKTGRITYTDTFRKHFLEEYAKDPHPTRIFKDAGLSPKVIGHKRIERSAYRWLRKAKEERSED